MSVLTANTRRDLEIHRYPILVYAMVPLAALVLQAWLPRLVGRYVWFDLPLVVTVYFALGRRSPIQGTLLGGALGLFEDAISHHAIGINGIAKTVAGFLAASVGVRIDVENHTIRLALNFALSLLQRHLPLHLPLPAGNGTGVELVFRTHEGAGELRPCADPLPAAGQDADQGLKRQGAREQG